MLRQLNDIRHEALLANRVLRIRGRRSRAKADSLARTVQRTASRAAKAVRR